MVINSCLWDRINRSHQTQGCLHHHPFEHLWIRFAGWGSTEPPLCRCVDYGMGHCRVLSHDWHCRYLYVSFKTSYLDSIRIAKLDKDAYMNDCFPRNRGEVSALVNLARTLGGFAVPFFQLPWAMSHGALQSFGCEAAYVTTIRKIADFR